MSNLLNSFYSNLNDLISINATDITSETISTNTLILNGVPFNPSNDNAAAIAALQLILTGASWDGVYNFLNLTNNLHVYGTLTVSDPQIDVGYTLTTLPSTYATNSNLQTNYVTYDAQTTEFNTRLANYVTNQSLTSTLSSYATNTNLSAVSAKITAISYVAGSPNVTTISDKLTCNVISYTGTLNGISPLTLGYISTLSSNAENRLVSNANDIQVLKDATRNMSSSSSQTTFSGTLNSSIFTFGTSINGFTYAEFNNAITNTKNLTSDASASILALQNKTQFMSYGASSSTFSNTLNSSTLVFSNTINGFNTADFSTSITYTKTLTSSAQDQLTAIGTTASAASAASATNTASLVVITGTTLPAMSALITGNTTAITTNTESINALNQKTTGISYNNTTSITTIASTCSLNTLRLTTLNSGFTQDDNSPIVIIGTTRFRNGVRISDGFGLDVSGNGSFGGSGSFGGTLSSTGNFTTTGNTTQIGDSASSTQTLNIYSKPTIFALTKIKNSSTTDSGLISPYLQIISSSANANPKKLQGILIGKEQATTNQSNCNIGYNYAADSSLSNYGYLGLNVNTSNVIESFRWFDGGCVVPVGNLTVTPGTLYASNLTSNAGTNLSINAASTNSVSLNASTINIGTNQGVGVANTVNIGAVTSISFINLNGVVNAPFGITSTNIFSQW
jgi:hypothetical protein